MRSKYVEEVEQVEDDVPADFSAYEIMKQRTRYNLPVQEIPE